MSFLCGRETLIAALPELGPLNRENWDQIFILE